MGKPDRLLGEHGINPSAYLWDRTACAFPGIRRYAGSREIAQHHGHVTGAAARIEHALQLDDNDFPKHIWSFSFLGKKFPKHGPVRYSLAHLADHKTHGNRFAEDFSVIDGLEQSGLFGLYTCPTNTAYIATSIIKPTDFSGSMRNLLLRRAEALYGDFCNLLPEWLKIPGSTSESWELDQFDWATPVGGDQGVAAFLDFRNAMIHRLLADKSPDSG